MAVRIVQPTEAHVAELAANMRQEDLEECLASGFESALDAVQRGVAFSSSCWTCLVDGRVMGMFGVTPDSMISGKVALWLLTTNLANERPLTFVKIARSCLSMLSRRYSRLSLGIDVHHARAIRFAAASGFSYARTYADPKTGEPFTHVTLGG